MKYTPKYRSYYKEKYQSMFLFDIDTWYTELLKRQNTLTPTDKLPKTLTNEEKVGLTEFLLKDILSTYTADGDSATVVHDASEHHYDANFESPFVIDDNTDLIPFDSQADQYADNKYTTVSKLFNPEFPCHKPTNHHQLTRGGSFLFLQHDAKQLNKAAEEFPNLAGKVVILRKWSVTGDSIPEAIIDRLSYDYHCDKPLVQYHIF